MLSRSSISTCRFHGYPAVKISVAHSFLLLALLVTLASYLAAVASELALVRWTILVIGAILAGPLAAHLVVHLYTGGGHVSGILPRLWSLSFRLPIAHEQRLSMLRLINYSFIVGAIAVIRSPNGQGYYLVRHRYPIGKRRQEVWGLPGGAVKKEQIREALKREVFQELRVDIAVGRVLVVDTSEPPRLDFFFECDLIDGTEYWSSSEVREAHYFPIDQLPGDISQRHADVLRAIDVNYRSTNSWPIFNPPQQLDISQPVCHKDLMVEMIDDRDFLPFSKQTSDQKVHRIHIPISFQPVDHAFEGKSSPCCKSHLNEVKRDYSFAWGRYRRLECIVPGTPQFICKECGYVFLPPQVAIPITRRATAIRQYFEFREDEALHRIEGFLTANDIEKVRDFADALREDPLFIPEGRFGPEGPSPAAAT